MRRTFSSAGAHVIRFSSRSERLGRETERDHRDGLDIFGPSWSQMTSRQRRLYPDLPTAEMDALWGMDGRD